MNLPSYLYRMMTHVVELLSARNIQAQDFLLGEREELDGISLEEHHRLVYAQLLSSHPCTWQLAPLYLASCPRKGQGFLEKLLLMQPISDLTQTHLKVCIEDTMVLWYLIIIVIGRRKISKFLC